MKQTQEIQNTNRYQKQMAEDLKEKTDFENLNLVNIQTLSQEDKYSNCCCYSSQQKINQRFRFKHQNG